MFLLNRSNIYKQKIHYENLGTGSFTLQKMQLHNVGRKIFETWVAVHHHGRSDLMILSAFISKE